MRNDWGKPALRLQKQLPVEAFRSSARPDGEWLIPVPRDISVIARDARRLPVRERPAVNQYKYVLVFSLAGRGSICMDGRKLRLTPGDVVLVFPHQAHLFAELEENLLRWVFVGFRLDRSELALRHLRNHPLPAPEAVRKALAPFLKAVKACRPAELAYNHEIAAWLWIMLLELTGACVPPELAASASSGTLHRKGAMLELLDVYVVEHLHEPIRMRDLARHMNLSPTCLRLRFRSAMGMSLGRYIRSRRLRQAIDRKLRTDATWSQIADQFGFGSVYSFSRAFKQEFHLAPRAYCEALLRR